MRKMKSSFKMKQKSNNFEKNAMRKMKSRKCKCGQNLREYRTLSWKLKPITVLICDNYDCEVDEIET